MSIRCLGRGPAALWQSGRLVGALAGVLAIAGAVGTTKLALAQEEAPTQTPEMQAKLQELLKQAQQQQPEDEQAKQPESAPKPTGPVEKSKDLSSEESIARFQQVLQRRPFHGPAFNGLVEDYIKRGKLPDLVAEYTAKSAALPDDVALKIVLARLQLRAGDAAAASKTLDKVDRMPADMARQNSELLVLRSEIYQKTGDNAAAERMLKEAQSLATTVSENLRLGEATADLLLGEGKKDEAVVALEELAAKFPDNYQHQQHVAAAMAQRGLHEAAVKRYTEMLKLVGNEVDRKCEVLRSLGLSQEKLGKREEAIAAYVEAIGLLSSDHWMQKELHERVVTLYRATNRLEDLATYCNTQIKRAPEQTSMRVLLADVQAAMGKVDDGKATLAQAVELFPKDIALSTRRVDFLERNGDAPGIAAEYQRIIGQHPADSELFIAYGQFLANNHQVEGARAQWRHVLETKVDDAGLALRLGALFEAYELYDDAGEAYERSIKVAPKQADGYVAISRMWMLRGDPEKAAAALDRLGAANPNDGAVQAALAQALRNLGKVDAALAAINRACEIAPDLVKYQQMRAELLVQSGQLEEALKVRRTLIDKIPSQGQQAEAIATLVSMHASADRLAPLVEQEQKNLQANPGNVVSLLILVRAADAQRDFPAMRRAIDELLKVQPTNEVGLTQLAKLQDATGDIDAAVATYTKLIQLHPNRARQFYESVVDVKLRYSDRAGAVATLESMAQADPTNVGTLAAVAEQLVRMEEADRAIPYFERALRAQPERHESRLEYGKALVQAGRLEEAAVAFKAVALQRTDTDRAVEALAKLHDVATQLGTLDELMDDLHKQIELDPQNAIVARVLSELMVEELEYERAMELLDLVLKHNPSDVDLALARGELLRKLGKFDEAVEGYQRVLRFPQIDRDYVLGELGKAHFEAGQIDQAKRLWRQIQNKMYAGSLLKNNGLLEDAVLVLEEGIRLRPDDYALHRNLVAALEAAGKTPEALAAARRLLDLEPWNIWNIEKLANAHLKNNDRAGAAQVAARLFSAGVAEDKTQQGAGQYGSYSSAMYQAQYASNYRNYGGYGGRGRGNVDRGIAFFTENGLVAELEDVLNKQIAAQPDNAVLKKAAADAFGSQLNKPEQALALLRELETASFPLEHQEWLGKSSQRDYMRVQQYNLIAAKPALRDQELGKLEARKVDELSRDEMLELAIIRKAQGNTDSAGELLDRAIKADPTDTLTLGVLTDLLVSAEKFKEAEPHARKLIELLGARREQMQAGIIERVRREFVRTLPLELQLRVSEDVLADIADKWTMGQGWSWYETGAETPGYLKARLTLATVCAETQRMDEARQIWLDLSPRRGPDVDRWTMLGDTAQLHKQEDLAFDFYSKALEAAKHVSGDPLYQQVYTANSSQYSYYGNEEGAVDKAFSSIVEAFSKRDQLVQLYDFLRDTNQEGKARRLAEQYKLGEPLKKLYAQRVEEARAAYKASPESRLKASVPYFAQVCKYAELHDREGKWDEAQKIYEQYCEDFPDELGLLQTLGEVAQARQKIDEAIQWEKKVLECKARLAVHARDWAQRDLAITPSRPQPLAAGGGDPWQWSGRWGGRYGYYYAQNALERWPSWMRLAQLYLAAGNNVAAGDAMQRGVGEASAQRDQIVREASELIQQRQLTAKMLPVLRTLAVYAPNDERLQVAFADSLEASGRKELALEVCNRLLRRGVTDLGVLAEVRRRVAALSPDKATAETTVESLKADVDANPSNLKNRLRLAKAYYYSLDVDKAAQMFEAIAKEAPHLEGIHEMLVEVYTLRGDSDKLIQALKDQIERTSEEPQRRELRWRLVNELLAAGRNDEALTTVKDLGDPRDPQTYTRIGTLLQYFGRNDEAIACLEKTKASARQQQYYYGRGQSDFGVAQAMVVKGDMPGAAAKIMEAVAEGSKSQVSYGGVYGMYENAQNPFQPLEQVFVLYPQLADEVTKQLEEKRAAAPTDPQLVKLAIALNRSLGRPDKAEELTEKMAESGGSDQNLVAQRIDAALKRKEFDKAIAMAEKFIAQQPKAKPMPGVPAQYAGYAALQSPRTFMLCKLGDVYWDMGQKDKAFDTYKQIVDEKIEQTKTAYATICMVRGRVKEATDIVEEALGAQQVKPPPLLQMKAELAALDGKPEAAFDAIAEAAKLESGQDQSPYDRGMGGSVQMLAQLAQMCGLTDKFAAFAREKIQKNPLDWESYNALADAYRRAGRPADAMAVLDEADKEAALAQQVLSLRMQWVRNTATPDELIALTQKSIELAEKHVDTSNTGNPYRYGRGGEQDPSAYDREQLGQLLWEKGDKEAAVAAWMQRANTQRAETYFRLGTLYLKQDAYGEAENAFARAVELDPDNAAYRTSLAEQMYSRGDRQAMLPHMLEAFLQTNSRPERQSRPNYNYYGGYDSEDQQPQAKGMTEWAAALVADPKINDYINGPEAGERAGEYRMMLAALTGDWSALESSLRDRIASGAYDPVIWNLWAKVQQRKGDWAEAAKALSFLERAKLTTIAQHRDKLKLVLAGKQYKEAAAGQRQAQPNAGMQPQNPGGQYSPAMAYGGYYPYNYYDPQQGSDLLPSIFIKLGDAARAERLYLIAGGGDGLEGRFPQLASLMWDQQAKDRALELMRLALMAPGDRYGYVRNMLPQYAGMLAEAGKVQDAVDLLIRAYRWDSSGDQSSMYESMYGRAYRDESMERGQSGSIGNALYEVLSRYDLFEPTLKKLAAESAANPKDPKLAQLVISLQRRAGRWTELRQSLAGWKAARPDDLAMKLEDFHAACQLQQWDDALKDLEEVRKDAPDQPERWTLHEAFVRFLQDDADKAAAVLEPLVASEVTTQERESDRGAVLLLCLNRLDKVVAMLEAQRASGELEDGSKPLLFRLYVATGKRDLAASLALDEFWKQPETLTAASPWFKCLATLEADGRGGAKPNAARPADEALLTVFRKGPKDAAKAFAQLCAQEPSTIEAMRGLVFAADLAGDSTQALQANDKLLAWLTPRRFDFWYSQQRPTLQRMAKKMVEQSNRNGTMQIAMNASAGSQFLQSFANEQRQEQAPALQTYDPLFNAHQKLHRALLARAAQADELHRLARAQERLLASDQDPNGYDRYNYNYSPYGYSRTYRSYPYQQGNDRTFPESDWKAVVRRSLWKAGRSDLLLAEYEKVGDRIPQAEWGVAGEAAAAQGQAQRASELRLKKAEALLAALESSDAPDLGSSTRDRWRWYYGYLNSGQDAQQVRGALMVGLTKDYESPDDHSLIAGEADQLWELALLEPSVEQRLLAAEKSVARGWGATQTFQQLLRYYRAKENPKKVIELVERAFEPDRLTSCANLDLYVWACYKDKAFDKLDAIFAAAQRFGSSMRNEVDIARLMTLRAAGKDAEADALESRLLAAAVRETPNKHRLRPELIGTDRPGWNGDDDDPFSTVSRSMSYRYYGRYYGGESIQLNSELGSIGEVAQTLGVRYDPKTRPEDTSLIEIRMAYQRHGMHTRAAVILDRELAETPEPADRKRLLAAKAEELLLANKPKDAAQTVSVQEGILRQEIKEQPGHSGPWIELAHLYLSRAAGQNYEKAAQALAEARKIDPSCDNSGALSVRCLYKLGKSREALEAWRAAQRAADENAHAGSYSAPTLFYAALAASGAGEKELATSLARQALYRYPTHSLAAQVQELTK